jgi:uncharacterized OsmC-like protein
VASFYIRKWYRFGSGRKKLKIAIQGDINPARLFGQSDEERAGFKQIDVEFIPITDASPELTKKWIDTIKTRCPINDNLAYPTPITFNVVEETLAEADALA